MVITVGPPAPLNIGTVEVGKIEQPASNPFSVIEVLRTTLVTFPVLPTIEIVPPPHELLHLVNPCEWLRMGSTLNNMSNKNL